MPVLPIRFSEPGREKLGTSLAVTNTFMTMLGISIILLGVILKFAIEDRLSLIDAYDEGVLSSMVIATGGVIAVIHCLGAKIWKDLGYHKTRERFTSIMMLWMLITFVETWVILTAAFMCKTHQGFLRDGFGQGLVKALNQYSTDNSMKIIIDRLQMDLKCCGSSSYSDWFNVSWRNMDYINKDNKNVKQMLTKDGELLLDSVPFSCCSPDVLMPCKQNQIKKQLAENQTITLHTKGCKDALAEYLTETLMEKTSRLIFWTYGLAWIVFIQARYLSTTISTAILWGYPTGEAPGYLCERCPCGCCDDGGQMPPPPKEGAEDEDEEEDEEDTSQPSQSYSEEQEGSPHHEKKRKDKKGKSKKGKGKSDTSKKSKPAKKPKAKKPKTKKPKMKKPKMKKMKFK